MASQTDERALEALIEKALTGSSREERQAVGELRLGETPAVQWGAPIGYEWGESAQFDKQLAIDTEKFWQFLQLTQHQELAKLQDRRNGSRLLLERIDKKLKKDRVLKLLKEGVANDRYRHCHRGGVGRNGDHLVGDGHIVGACHRGAVDR